MAAVWLLVRRRLSADDDDDDEPWGWCGAEPPAELVVMSGARRLRVCGAYSSGGGRADAEAMDPRGGMAVCVGRCCCCCCCWGVGGAAAPVDEVRAALPEPEGFCACPADGGGGGGRLRSLRLRMAVPG